MFGKILTLVLLVSCMACANPRWAPEENASPQDASQDGKENTAATCRLVFKSGLCLDWEWEKLPNDSDFGALVFKTYRWVNDQRVPEDLSGTAALVLWMPSMGHGSSPTTVTRAEQGVYRATRVFFVMPGAWDLHFQNKSADKVIDETVDSIILE